MNKKVNKLFFSALMLGIVTSGYAQTEEERRAIVKDYDHQWLQKFAEERAKEFTADREEAIEYAKSNNLPLYGVDKDGNYFELVGFFNKERKQLKYYTTYNNGNKSSVTTARAQHIRPGGSMGLNLDGTGMIVGIWDGGQPLSTHQSLGIDRVIAKDGDFQDMTQDGSGARHATHVAGTMVSSGATSLGSQGLAPKARLWANTWRSDLSEMTTQAAQGLLISNHSYGARIENVPLNAFGSYSSRARFLDELLYNAPYYLPVYAAGNDRNDYHKYNPSKAGGDLLTEDAVAKNQVVVAAIEGINEYTGPNSVKISTFSNWGPTDDFRVKPDIAMKGVAVNSLSNQSNFATTSMNGTSMAAPGVSGVFVLWQQYFKRLFPLKGKMTAATVKALMVATADEAGAYDGPDHKFGWGLINAKKGAEVLKKAKEKSAIVEEITLNNGQVYEKTFVIGEGNDAPLVATIAWTDPASPLISGLDNNTAALVNDLDLRIIRSNNTQVLPWRLRKNWTDIRPELGDNNVDNVEKVEYKSPLNNIAGKGVYTIRVSHKGVLSKGKQNFSLVVYTGNHSAASNAGFQFEGVNIYPNPAKDIVNIADENNVLDGAEIKLYDLQGKLLIQERKTESITTVDISGLSNGIYLLELSNNGQKQVQKIVKK